MPTSKEGADVQAPDHVERAWPGEVIPVYGNTKSGDDGFRRFFQFGPGMPVNIPEGDATAIKSSGGGTERERQAFLENTASLVGAGHILRRPTSVRFGRGMQHARQVLF